MCETPPDRSSSRSVTNSGAHSDAHEVHRVASCTRILQSSPVLRLRHFFLGLRPRAERVEIVSLQNEFLIRLSSRDRFRRFAIYNGNAERSEVGGRGRIAVRKGGECERQLFIDPYRNIAAYVAIKGLVAIKVMKFECNISFE